MFSQQWAIIETTSTGPPKKNYIYYKPCNLRWIDIMYLLLLAGLWRKRESAFHLIVLPPLSFHLLSLIHNYCLFSLASPASSLLFSHSVSKRLAFFFVSLFLFFAWRGALGLSYAGLNIWVVTAFRSAWITYDEAIFNRALCLFEHL